MMSSNKNAVEYEGKLELAEAIARLEDLVSGLKAGGVSLALGGRSLSLTPASVVTLELEAKQKAKKGELSLKLKWRDQMQVSAPAELEIKPNAGGPEISPASGSSAPGTATGQ
jgi:amphi-Trp domain-containing protein